MTTLKILACQITIPPTDTANSRDTHLQHTADKADEHLSTDAADILLLPELSTLDYASSTFANLTEVAEEDDGKSYKTWSNIAKTHHCWVLYGYARRSKHGYSIATGVVNPSGDLTGVYEKLHLAQFGASEEKNYFNTAGNQLLVFECNGFRLAPIICYDLRFAELTRTLVLQHKVDCILHTGAYARDPSFDSWHAFVKTRAMENQIYMVSLNRAGGNYGHSVFMPPWTDENTPPVFFAEHDEEYKMLTLDKAAIAQARKEYHFLDDRLPSYNLPATDINFKR